MEKHHEITLKSSLNLIISPSYHDIPMVSPYITWYFDPLSAVDPPSFRGFFPNSFHRTPIWPRWSTSKAASSTWASRTAMPWPWVARQVSQKDEAEATAVNIQGLVNVPFWGYWTSPLNGNYRWDTSWLGDVQWWHLMTHDIWNIYGYAKSMDNRCKIYE